MTKEQMIAVIHGILIGNGIVSDIEPEMGTAEDMFDLISKNADRPTILKKVFGFDCNLCTPKPKVDRALCSAYNLYGNIGISNYPTAADVFSN